MTVEDSTTIDLKQYRKWKDVIRAIEAECWSHAQVPKGGILKTSYLELSVSLPLPGSDRFVFGFVDTDLDTRSPIELAHHFYDEYKGARSRRLRP